MTARVSCVFLSTPTSGTGSLWRLITAIGGNHYTAVKISEQMENAGRGNELTTWSPEPFGHLYMFNTPQYANANLGNQDFKLITNFRDPRDLACNQFHWAMQHPMVNRSEEYIENFRRTVAENGIDKFVAKQDNTILFKAFRAIEARLKAETANTLKLTYNQLCLDFDALVERIITFLDVPREGLPWDVIEKERATNLTSNPAWIGQMWTGTDIMPGRYRKELSKETIAVVDERYRDILRFMRAIEIPRFRSLLATEAERAEAGRVLVGTGDELFLQNDANDTVGQITGRMKIPFAELVRIGMAHRSRQLYGETLARFQYAHAVIPSKEVAHRAQLPAEAPFEGQGGRPIRQYIEAGVGELWKPFYEPGVLEPQDGKRFYPATDSHWNHAGAFTYFRAFLRAADGRLADRLDALELRRFPGRQKGDLGGKLDMEPEAIEILAPMRHGAKLVFENAISNEGCIRWYRNEALAEGGRAFVMHDSFTQWLLGILPELFSEVVLFHGTVFDYDFVRRLAPQTVFCIQAERFLTRAPDTGGDMLKFVAQQEREKGAKHLLADYLAAHPLSGT